MGPGTEPVVLVVDVGTSGVRAATVDRAARLGPIHHLPLRTSSPAPGFVELDAADLAAAALAVARAAAEQAGPVAAVGITNQRATTVVWDRATGEPVGPALGWQDVRTAPLCLALQAQGIRLAPNESATKLGLLLDLVDPDRARDLCFGTIDTWVAWTLTDRAAHVTDPSNAGVTGLVTPDVGGWADPVLDALGIPPGVLPRLVDSSGVVAEATALPGSPPVAGLAGDQQASLLGQGATEPGLAKLTLGTGGMLDVCVGGRRPGPERLGPHGTFPVVAWRVGGVTTWGLEAVMLTAGQAVAWLRDDLGLVPDAAATEELAAGCPDTGDAWFVPALAGLGTPAWDLGARGTLVGLRPETEPAQVVRAVLEGVAHRSADLLEAAEADAGLAVDHLRLDGGMAANRVVVQAVADATQRPVEVAPVTEATTLGAAFLAGMAVGLWSGFEEVAATWAPARVVTPGPVPDRERWREACERARAWVPELSAIHF